MGPTFTMEVRMPFSAILGATALVDEIKLEAQLDSLLMLGHIGLLQETSERTRYFDNLYQRIVSKNSNGKRRSPGIQGHSA